MRIESASAALSPGLTPRRIVARPPVRRTAANREQAFSLDGRKSPVLLWLVERRRGLVVEVRTNLDPRLNSPLAYTEPKPHRLFGGFRHWTAPVADEEDLSALARDLDRILDEDPTWRPYAASSSTASLIDVEHSALMATAWARLRELDANPASQPVAEAARARLADHFAAMRTNPRLDDIAELAADLLLAPEELLRRARTPPGSGVLEALDLVIEHARAERVRLEESPLTLANQSARDVVNRVVETALQELGVQPRPISADATNNPDAAYRSLLARCRALLTTDAPDFAEDDFLRNLFLTVLDFRMHGTAVANALDHFDRERRAAIPDLDALRAELSHFTDDEPGNREAAQYLWGNHCWTRLGLLRRLIEFFDSIGVRDQESLRAWVRRSTFEADFRGKVRGLAARVYEWLRIRVGVEDIKMDVWVIRFVEATLGPAIPLRDAKRLLLRAAEDIQISPRRLDALIWWVTSGRGQA